MRPYICERCEASDLYPPPGKRCRVCGGQLNLAPPPTTIRIPARLSSYMDGTGWGQGAEEVSDEPRRLLLMVMDLHRPVVIKDPSPALLARLRFEADHLMDIYRFGDHDSDTLADYNAGLAVVRAVARLADWSMSEDRDRMYGEVPG